MEDYFREGNPNLEMMGTLILIKESKKLSVWNIGVGGSIECDPAMHDGVIYFGACDKNFYALDAETGEKIG